MSPPNNKTTIKRQTMANDKGQDMKREQRYIVLKLKDIAAAGLTRLDAKELKIICDKVTGARIHRGKAMMDAVVVESDWPEYEPTWQAIERRVDDEIRMKADAEMARRGEQ